MIENVFECALCGACTADCATGWDPTEFALETRKEAALGGQLPAYILQLVKNRLAFGNVYGCACIGKELSAAIEKNAKPAKTLLFLGEDARYRDPAGAVAAISILKRAGVDFTVLNNEPAGGASLYFLTGKTEEARVAFAEAAEAVKGYDTVVVYGDLDAKGWLRDSRECGVEPKPAIKTFVSFLAELLRAGKLPVRQSSLSFTPQDNALIARDLGDGESIRAVLSACGEVTEMLLRQQETVYAGSLIMNEYMPQVMCGMAQRRVADAARMGGKIIVTESPSEYVLLKAAETDAVKVKRIEEVVASCF